MKPRYFVQISYNGNNYHGWQIQSKHITVQQTLNEHIGKMLGEAVICHGCGRTDSGVHARKYFFHFDCSRELDYHFFNKLNAFLPKDIALIGAYTPLTRIHARWDALYRSYNYLVHCGKNPFMEGLAYIVNDQFDLELMNQASLILKSYSDFECFSKSNNGLKHYLCEIFEARWTKEEDLFTFHITANRFVRSMVRLIVGTMLDVGRKKISIEEFRAIIESKDRTKSGFLVPACGLYLNDVAYPDGALFPIVK